MLTAAGLLTIAAAGPVMAQKDFSGGEIINSSAYDRSNGRANIFGNVTWNVDTFSGGVGVINGINYETEATIDLQGGSRADTAAIRGITVNGGYDAVLDNTQSHADISVSGDVATGSGTLTVNVGNGFFDNSGQTISGTVIIDNSSAAGALMGDLIGVNLTLSGVAEIDRVSQGDNFLRFKRLVPLRVMTALRPSNI